MDKATIAIECFHGLHNSTNEGDTFMALKHDMQKTYDLVEWDFLMLVMEKMKFHVWFIDCMMRYITSVSFSVLINAQPSLVFGQVEA